MTDGFPVAASADENELARIVQWARRGPHTPAEIASLATHLANSGERLSWAASARTVDVASTGGPGSLSTLVAPLALVVRGCEVVKLAVPGRPAGAIDVLATVPGYRVYLTPAEVRGMIDRCHFAHFLSEGRFAPLDAALYEYRRRNGSVAVPVLAAVSLLAKKLAVGVRFVGLDVRVGPHGNFGTAHDEARTNAAAFCTAARILGMEAMAFVSSNDGLAQPWIGRGEALIALASALGVCQIDDRDFWLRGHVSQCCEMATVLAGEAGSANRSASPAKASVIGPAELQEALEAHLIAQGATMEAFQLRVEATLRAPRVTLDAAAAGVLSVDLGIIRSALVARQEDSTAGVFSDPAGLELLVRPGQAVAAGEPIARVRCEGGDPAIEKLLMLLRPAFRTVPMSEPLWAEGANVRSDAELWSQSPTMEVVRA